MVMIYVAEERDIAPPAEGQKYTWIFESSGRYLLSTPTHILTVTPIQELRFRRQFEAAVMNRNTRRTTRSVYRNATSAKMWCLAQTRREHETGHSYIEQQFCEFLDNQTLTQAETIMQRRAATYAKRWKLEVAHHKFERIILAGKSAYVMIAKFRRSEIRP